MSVLQTLRVESASGWPEGVFFSSDLLHVGIVVASELPRDRSTLLVRLMAAGPLLSPAIRELSALPSDAPEYAVAEEHLLHLKKVLGKKPKRSRREQEFVMTMMQTWEDARRSGRADGTAHAVLNLLSFRGIEVPDSLRERILAERDLERLERWHERAIVATSVS